MRRRTRARIAPVAILALALAGIPATSCKSSSSTVTAGLTANFTADPTPAGPSVTLQPGTSTNGYFQVRVSVANVNDFFGAAFRLVFDPTVIGFVSWDTSNSFLLGSGVDTNFRADALTIPGQLIVTATRLQPTNGTVISGVSVSSSQDLAVITFRAIKSTTGSTIEFITPHEVDSSAAPPTNVIPVDWAGGTLIAF